MVQREEIGFRSGASTVNLHSPTRSQVKKFLPEEGLMLTGDENIADINFFVQWRIINIRDYLYNVHNVKATVKSAAESAMREVIGYTTIAEALTHGKAKIQEDAKQLLQHTLDEYGSGVMVENLSLLKVEAPSEVIDAFRDVQTARADQNNKINKAESYRNDIIPRARGQAEQMIQSAEGYKAKVTEEAKGDAEKFKNIYAQYVKAKDVTKKRMYLEAMEKILEGAEKVILSSNLDRSTVPYLPLKQLTSKK
jgi:membrane protease subunit HflK